MYWDEDKFLHIRPYGVKTAFTTNQYFGYCTTVLAKYHHFLLFPTLPPAVCWRVCNRLG